MTIIADSGSTKTAWYIESNDITKYVNTQGINPFQMSTETIIDILHSELLNELPDTNEPIEIFFYGAGCTLEKCPIVQGAIRSAIPEAKIHVGSDMLGAARALCGSNKGIIAILGTGANSCYYNGKEIIMNVPPLGFILGDEGSGAYIGKRLVSDCLKGQLTDKIKKMFLSETHETSATIIQKVYREPLPNRFLATLSMFCARHKDEQCIHDLLIDCFQQFFIRNVYAYSDIDSDDKTVNFVGSIAHFYKTEVNEAARSLGYKVGKVIQAPLDGLVEFHCGTKQ